MRAVLEVFNITPNHLGPLERALLNNEALDWSSLFEQTPFFSMRWVTWSHCLQLNEHYSSTGWHFFSLLAIYCPLSQPRCITFVSRKSQTPRSLSLSFIHTHTRAHTPTHHKVQCAILAVSNVATFCFSTIVCQQPKITFNGCQALGLTLAISKLWSNLVKGIVDIL